MLSIWEKRHLVNFDYIVIGSGITGLSTACSMKELKPKANVLVLERGLFPTGASTKNAGFACIGSFTEKAADYKLMGEKAFLQLIDDRKNGLLRLRKRLGDEHIDYQNNGGYELIMHKQQVQQEELDAMNQLLYPLFRKQVFSFQPELVKQFGFSPDFVTNIIVNPLEGQIDTGRMIQSLYRYAGFLQVKVITGAEVIAMNETEAHIEVQVKNPVGNEPILFKAAKLAVCTNAFTKQLLPDIEITPGRGQVLATTPIPNLKFKGVFSFDDGYYYFRNFENRIIFGGGRNLDFETETTTAFGFNKQIMNQLEFYLEEMIVPGTPFQIDQRWTGIMAFGKDKLPVVKKISDRIAVGARLNGMGIALGSKIGDDLATLLVKNG